MYPVMPDRAVDDLGLIKQAAFQRLLAVGDELQMATQAFEQTCRSGVYAERQRRETACRCVGRSLPMKRMYVDAAKRLWTLPGVVGNGYDLMVRGGFVRQVRESKRYGARAG